MFSSRSTPLQWQASKWLALSAITLALAACGGGGGNAARSSDPALAAQINDIKPAEAGTLVPVFVELGSPAAANGADLATDPDQQRQQLQKQFLADLQAAVAKPATGANASGGCDAAALADRLGKSFSPSSGAAVRVELSACELDLLPQVPNVKGVHADIPLGVNTVSPYAYANSLPLEVQRSFDGTGTTAAIDSGISSAWPTPSGGGKADGAGYVVAVLDTGVEERHPALGAGKVLQGACFSSSTSTSVGLCPNGASVDTVSSTAGRSCAESSAWAFRSDAISAGCAHGTAMASVATMNFSGVSGNAAHGGVAKRAKVLPIQVFGKVGNSISASSSDMLAAIEWLTSRADALKASGNPVVSLNMSLGGGSYTSACDSDYVGSLFKTAFANLRAKGIIPVAAAGNNSTRNAIVFPACVSNTVSVAAAKLNYDGVAPYSNFSSQVKLFAPGGAIIEGMYTMPVLCPSATNFGCWDQNAGTSPATAFVSGAVAALRTAAPKASLSEIETALTADLSTAYPSLAKQLTEPTSTLKRPALRITASAYKLLNLPDPQTNPVPVPAKFTISGNVSGLASGASVTLLNNGGDALTVQTNGGFTFKTPIAANSGYNVTVSTQPSNQTCTVGNASGSATANVSNVGVTCTTNNTGGGGGPKLYFKELCVFANPNYTGSTACGWWDGTSGTVYGYYGAIRSVSVRNIAIDLTNFQIDRSAPPITTEGSFILKLTPFSSSNVVTLKVSSPNVSALLPVNALVRQLEIRKP